jgi:hypothetical protein
MMRCEVKTAPALLIEPFITPERRNFVAQTAGFGGQACAQVRRRASYRDNLRDVEALLQNKPQRFPTT